MKKIAVFGATGQTGLQIISQALEKEYTVHAFTRSPEKLSQFPKLQVFHGNIFTPDPLIECIGGTNAVLIALGANPMDANKVRSRATQAIVQAMQEVEVKRVVCMSTLGAGSSINLMPKTSQMMFKMFLGEAVKDHEVQEKILENSDLDWTVVRPARLTNGPHTQNYQVDIQEGQAFQSQISRADVADCMLNQVEDRKFLHEKIVISY